TIESSIALAMGSVWKYEYEGELINVNGLKCTPNHKIPLRYKIKHKKINKNDYLVRDIYALE
ncbi:hypothetical protein, partial [Providencia stuartii]|uniref:hypothetical protein n=1 Tax=Providencia stuartii TaxID=588 RepID=UPI001953C072